MKSFFKPERIPFELLVDDVDVLSEEVVAEAAVSDEETAVPLLIFAPSIIPS